MEHFNNLRYFIYCSMIYKDDIDKAVKLLAEIYEANEKTPGWNYLGNRK